MNKQEALDILKSFAPYHKDSNEITITSTILGGGRTGVVRLGSMSPSFLVPQSKTMVAVKQAHPTRNAAQNDKVALAVAQELHVWAGLAHPNVIHLVGFCLDGVRSIAWLISPYMKNGNIRKYLDQHNPGMIVRVRMLGEVARGIAYLHRRNLCHGDIKGANVLVDDDGHAKVSDFGLTKLMESDTGSTTSSGLHGTLRYMAPELFDNDLLAHTKKTDVWAWSCLGIEILCDKIPYSGTNIDAVVIMHITLGDPPLDLDSISIDERIKQLFRSCWVANPIERPNMNLCVSSVNAILQVMKGQAGAIPDGAPMAIQHADLDKSPYKVAKRLLEKHPKDTDIADLEVAIAMHRQALLLQPMGHLDHRNILVDLASLLRSNYHQLKDVSSLDEAIDLDRQALLLGPEDHPEQSKILYNLAVALFDKSRSSNDLTTLQEAIDLHYQALESRPRGHPRRSNSLYSLAVSLLEKFHKRNDLPDLYESIDLHREGLQLRPVGHPERHYSLHGLAISLLDVKGNVALLYEAIDLEQSALLLRPEGHPERNYSVNTLVTLREKINQES